MFDSNTATASDRSFLSSIAADPDNRETPLVYADWLEDQGDARGELIRVMEEM